MLKIMAFALLSLTTVSGLSQSTSAYTVGTITAVVPHQTATNTDTHTSSYDVTLKIGDTLYLVLYTPQYGMETARFATGREASLLVGTQTIKLTTCSEAVQKCPL